MALLAWSESRCVVHWVEAVQSATFVPVRGRKFSRTDLEHGIRLEKQDYVFRSTPDPITVLSEPSDMVDLVMGALSPKE
jgi:hypothetical protein